MFYYLYIYMLFIMSMFFFILSLYFIINKIIIFLEFELIKIISVKIEYLILMDWISLMFISVVLLISTMVMYYSIEYLSGDLNIDRFMMMVMLFIISMFLMIMSPNLISILLGWDGLGLVSYCLVIYYQNENSFNSGMVTVLTNRIGDILILMLIGLMMSIGSLSFMFLMFLDNYLLLLMMIASFTKSAQIPFSAWLPMAMAAPTPVSSLVHSSTLVTAGVYLLIRFNYLMLNSIILKFMMFISIMTLFMSGLGANFENDLKKIIALSTLSQLGVMIFCLSIMLPEISFFHLLTHAMFKSVLFMCAGVMIHNMLGMQDIRFISMIFYNMPLISMIFNCSTFSLCGLPFLSGFFSKDMILEMFLMSLINKIMFIFMFISMGFTIMYSIRLIYFSFIKLPMINIYSNYKSLMSFMSYSMFMLYFMSIMVGSMISWMLFSMKNLIYLTINFKLMIYFFMMIGVLGGVVLSKYYMFNFNKNLLIIHKFLSKMWFIDMIYGSQVFKIFNFSSGLILSIEFGWNEMMFSGNFINFMKKFFFVDIFNKNYLGVLMLIIYIIMIMIF